MEISLRQSDPVTYEVIVNALAAIPNEMSIRIMRSGNSTVFRETLEFSTAICDPDGVVVAQGLTLPVHVGALPIALPMALKEVDESWQPGDVLIFNDPQVGGLHLPDIFVVMPIFLGETLIGYSACTGHHVDVGGRFPGGNAPDSRTIYEEGLRLPPVKLWRSGELVRDVAKLIRGNVRLPNILLSDLAAQRAACESGVAGLVELCARYGQPVLRRVMTEYVDYSAELLAERLRAIPKGRYEFTDYVEWLDGATVAIRCEIGMEGGRPKVSFDGSSPAVDYAINCPFSYTQAAVATVLLGALGHGVPLNGGLFRAFDVTAPADSVVSWRMPYACAARGVTMYRVCDALAGALAQAVPTAVPAASEGGATIVTIAGDHGGEHFNFFDVVLGAWGGRKGLDGFSGVSNPATNSRNTPVEMIEREHPVRVTRYEIAPGTGGDGEFCGGDALCRGYELLADEAMVVVRADRQSFAPWGLAGGQPGATGSTRILRKGGKAETMPSKFVARLFKGDCLELTTPAGGGYGDPAERRSMEAARGRALEAVSP